MRQCGSPTSSSSATSPAGSSPSATSSAHRDVEGWPDGRAPRPRRRRDAPRSGDGLRLGYTESTGHPLLRREIAGLYEAADPDDVLVFAGAEEAIFCARERAAGPGRPRDRHLAGLPEPVRGRAGRAARTSPSTSCARRMAGRSTSTRFVARSRPLTRLIVVNAPHNPTGMLPDRADVRWRWWRWRRGRRAPPRRRGLPLPRVRRAGPAAGRRGCRRARRLARRDVEVVRDGRAADRLARHARPRPARAGAPRSRTTRRSARRPRRRSSRSSACGPARSFLPGRARSSSATWRSSTASSTDGPGPLSWVRPRGGSIGFPRLRAGVDVDRFAADLVEAEGVLLLPGSRFGHPGNHFRIGFGRTDLPEAVAGLERYLARVARG